MTRLGRLRKAKRELENLLMTLHWHRRHRDLYLDKGDAAGVEQCEWALRLDHRRIREHCAEHGLDLPHDVPPENAA